MSDEIKEKIQILEQRHHFLTETWEKRKTLYNQNLDTQVLRIEKKIKSWLYYLKYIFCLCN